MTCIPCGGLRARFCVDVLYYVFDMVIIRYVIKINIDDVRSFCIIVMRKKNAET